MLDLSKQIEIENDDDFIKKSTKRELAITIYANSTNPKPTVESNESWLQIKSRLKVRDIRQNKNGKAFSGVKLSPNTKRSNDSVELIDLMIADIDTPTNKNLSLDNICWLFDEYEFMAYTTHGHNPENGAVKYRIVFPLLRSVLPHEYPQVWSGFNALLGSINDQSTKDISRIFYLPSCPAETLHSAWWADNSGAWLDPDYLIAISPKPKRTNLATPKYSVTLPETEAEIAKVKDMLSYIPADCNRKVWVEIIWSIAATGWKCAKKLAYDWSMTYPELFVESEFEKDWLSFDPNRQGGIKSGTLKHHAELNGWVDLTANDALSSLQQKFSLIQLGGKIGLIDRERLNGKNIDGTAAALVVINRTDGSLLLNRLLNSQFPQTDAKKTAAQFFIDKNTTLYQGVEFHPRGSSPDTLNLWVGFTVQPAIGEWSLIDSFLLNVICGGRNSEYQYFIRYIAHALQRPEEKPGVMIWLIGGQGIGKGTLARLLRKIWSATFLMVNRIDHVTGDFNGSLERAYIVFLDEALFAGDYRSTDALKSLVTEQTININEKHQPARQINSYHRFLGATNAEHYKSTDRDDRRDFAIRVSESQKGNHAYWDALNSEMINGGVEALVHYLLNLDLTGFNVTKRPNTRELTEQKLQSLDKFPRWWFDCLSRGSIQSGDQNEWPGFVSTSSLLLNFKVSGHDTRSYKSLTERDVRKLISKLCPSAKVGQSKEGLSRKRGYELTTLALARKDFESYIGDSIEWEDI